jgi:hypothetical protein
MRRVNLFGIAGVVAIMLNGDTRMAPSTPTASMAATI